MKKYSIFLSLFALIAIVNSQSIWPWPQSVSAGSGQTTLDPTTFQFQCLSSCSSVLVDAFDRYTNFIFFADQGKSKLEGSFSTVYVSARTAPPLTYDVDESYTITVNASYGMITANTEWGALRALETFYQLTNWDSSSNTYYINDLPISISDFPRFSWRGLLIDTARHYQPVHVILRMIDAMSFNKMNVLHWHIVDDQSFPYVSSTYPLLSQKGSWVPTAVYRAADVQKVINHAYKRGVRVVVEIDSPGHSYSWSHGYPNLFPKCSYTNVLNPTTSYTQNFVKNFFQEVTSAFIDDYIHLGGDEVSYNCWQADPTITTWMQQNGIAGNYSQLQAYYERMVEGYANQFGKYPVFWQEAYDRNGGKLKYNTSVVNVWLDGPTKIQQVVQNGYRALYSTPWYLDRQDPDGELFYFWEDVWKGFYMADPTSGLNLTPEELALVVGGEASQWGEQCDQHVIDSRIWPRASAIGERLWSAANVNSTDEATPRLGQFRCTMVRRGINASPIYPDYCETGRNGF